MGFMSIFWIWFRTVTLKERSINAIRMLLAEYDRKDLDTGITWEYWNSVNGKTSNWKDRFCVGLPISQQKEFLLIKLPSQPGISETSRTTILQISDDKCEPITLYL
ncbi:10878_t:CDS:2 [Ambispora leptoticha]|uniref:10878_t:CDS:1 n=1 Tax=Ambispora leptoticha TaxID=144679 RepID=A0A9N9FNY6_9GLOM|nr:10878_t:CDS:2 [Ambispora leptoticha]